MQHLIPARENVTFLPYQENSMIQHIRSDPNIKFSSSYPSSINIRSGSLVSNSRQLAHPAEFSRYKTCKAGGAAAGSEYGCDYGDSEYGEKYGDRKTQMLETKLDTRMESLFLSVADHALGLDE